MTFTHATPPQFAQVSPAALAMAANRQSPLPATERPAGENAAPEVSAVAVLGYN